jgi:YidC/Oxa1 family membrane protein insertase
MFELFAKVLSGIYEIVPNYAVAIAGFTLVAMVVTTPFTLKGTRSMIQMQRLQPEMKRLQLQYKDDRQKLNEELMAFHKENNLSPLGGCLPLLLQTPIFLILYRVIHGLTSPESGFEPKYLDHASQLYQDLVGQTQMVAFGIDLAQSPSEALQEGIVHGLPYLGMVAIVAASSFYQQRQIQGRNPNQEINPQQQMIMRLMPLMIVFFSFVAPAAIVIYFVVSNLYRIGMQHYITRTLYHGEDSLGAQAQRAAAEAKKLQAEDGSGAADLLPRVGKRKQPPTPSTGDTGNGNGATPGATPPRQAPAPANRSKKKKKRR